MITSNVNRRIGGALRVLTIKNKEDAIMLIVATALLVYTILMAFVSDITYDEAWTYMHYALPSSPGFLDFDLANNHPLNSFLIYISAFLFPYNELAIRLPNLIFLSIYLLTSIKISRSFSSLKLFVFGGLTLYWTLIPFYFSLGRGYGIATALVLLFIHRFISVDNNSKNIIKNIYILLLASFAYVGLLPLVVAVIVFYLVFEIRGNLYQFIQKYLWDIIVLLIGFSFIAYYLVSISSTGKPLYGGVNISFLDATVGWYLNSFSNYMPNLTHVPILVTTIIMLAIVSVLVLKNRAEFKVTIITVSTFILFYVISTLLNKPFITGRLLMPFYPLTVISIAEILKLILEKTRVGKRSVLQISSLLFILLILNHLQQFRKKNNSYEYKSEIFEKLNFSIAHDGCCSSIPFYKAKFFNKPPMKALLKFKPTFKDSPIEGFHVYYFQKENILLLEASKGFDINPAFYFHVHSLNQKYLPNDRKKFGFENLDFNWDGFEYENKKYMLIKLPHYELKAFNIGQFDRGQYETEGAHWLKTYDIKKYINLNLIPSLLSTPPTMEEIANNELRVLYYQKENILLIEASKDANLDPLFYFHVHALNKNDLPKDRRIYGFESLNFSWSGLDLNDKKYKIIRLPSYKLKEIKLGQYNKGKYETEGAIWLNTYDIKYYEDK